MKQADVGYRVPMIRGLAVLLAIAGISAAAITSISTTYPIPGVDASGNPSSLTGVGTGKIYKESRTGIVFGVFAGVVPNQLGAATFFINQGLPITDPVTQESLTATADLEIVFAPTNVLSQASLTLVSVPSDE